MSSCTNASSEHAAGISTEADRVASAQPQLRALYISYLGLSDPLVETQVVAYLEGLAYRGHHIHLLTFEHERHDDSARRSLARRLSAGGISWHFSRYHKRPSL